MPTKGTFREERLVRPIGAYDEFCNQGPGQIGHQQADDRHDRREATFLRIDTDQGVHGIAGPFLPTIGRVLATQPVPLLAGCDR